MARGKHAAAATARRLQEAQDEIGALRETLARERAEREDLEREADRRLGVVKAEIQRRAAVLAESLHGQRQEQRIEAEVARRLSAGERQIRVDMAREVGRWIEREDVRATFEAYTRLADALNLGRDASAIYGDHAKNRQARRASVRTQNLNRSVQSEHGLVV